MTNFWIEAGKLTLSGSKNYFSAIAITWLVAGIAGGEVPVVPQFAQTGLTVVCLYFYTAAAARTRGLTQESTFWSGMSRPGAEAEPIVIALVMLMVAVAGFVGGMLVAEETGAGVGLACAALVCLAVMTRVWPVFSVPFFFKGKYRWSPAGHGLIWSGPGLDLALRISRLPFAKKTATPAFIIPLLALLLPLLGARLLWGPGFLPGLLFYAVVLPYLSMLNLNLTVQLLAENERQKEGNK